MNREYYLKYYEFERKHWWFRARAEILQGYIERHCRSSSGLKILNVGAATGGSIDWLSKLGEVTSLEIDKESVLFIKDHLKANIQEGTIESLPFAENSFDLVCAFDVVEHVENDQLAVHELARVSKANGSVLITVPAHMHLWSQHDVINHHHRRYNVESLKRILNDLPGGKIQFMSYFNYHLYRPILFARKINNLFSNLFKSKSLRSDFETFGPGLFNGVFFSVMASEKNNMAAQRTYPTGVSILAHWKKD